MKLSVIRQNGRWYCNHCGNRNQELFSCYQDQTMPKEVIIYCRNCVAVINSSTQTVIESSVDVITEHLQDCLLQIPFPLTPWQQKASIAIQKGWNENYKIQLLHAVCGAGKTEIVIDALVPYLQKGWKIGWAITRKDVVIDICERLCEYLPRTEIVALYQNSADLGKSGQITVLTTARLLTFNNYFDLLIIDENDAYPFSLSKTQKFAATKSLKQKGTALHISATILTREWKNYDNIITVAKRFHNFPLPAINFSQCFTRKIWEKEKLPRKIKRRLQYYYQQQKPLLIFVATKERTEQVAKIIKDNLPKLNIVAVSSQITNRVPLLNNLRKGKINVLVTTTILERGITFKDLQVLILDTENILYDAQTIIQIAGRVGRNLKAPNGDCILYYEDIITAAMKQAQKYHKIANKGRVLFL